MLCLKGGFNDELDDYENDTKEPDSIERKLFPSLN